MGGELCDLIVASEMAGGWLDLSSSDMGSRWWPARLPPLRKLLNTHRVLPGLEVDSWGSA
jgi:hypothetical protein